MKGAFKTKKFFKPSTSASSPGQHLMSDLANEEDEYEFDGTTDPNLEYDSDYQVTRSNQPSNNNHHPELVSSGSYPVIYNNGYQQQQQQDNENNAIQFVSGNAIDNQYVNNAQPAPANTEKSKSKWNNFVSSLKSTSKSLASNILNNSNSKEQYQHAQGSHQHRKPKDVGIFGQGIEYALEGCEDTLVPIILIRCAKYVEMNALDEVGIYRLSGSSSAIQALKGKFDTGDDVDLDANPVDYHTVTGVFKLYLRSLPLPVIPPETSSLLSDISLETLESDPTAVLENIMNVLQTLPQAHFHTLVFIMRHLNIVSQHSEINKMTTTNLGLIFAPTLGLGSAGICKTLIAESERLFMEYDSENGGHGQGYEQEQQQQQYHEQTHEEEMNGYETEQTIAFPNLPPSPASEQFIQQQQSRARPRPQAQIFTSTNGALGSLVDAEGTISRPPPRSVSLQNSPDVEAPPVNNGVYKVAQPVLLRQLRTDTSSSLPSVHAASSSGRTNLQRQTSLAKNTDSASVQDVNNNEAPISPISPSSPSGAAYHTATTTNVRKINLRKAQIFTNAPSLSSPNVTSDSSEGSGSGSNDPFSDETVTVPSPVSSNGAAALPPRPTTPAVAKPPRPTRTTSATPVLPPTSPVAQALLQQQQQQQQDLEQSDTVTSMTFSTQNTIIISSQPDTPLTAVPSSPFSEPTKITAPESPSPFSDSPSPKPTSSPFADPANIVIAEPHQQVSSLKNIRGPTMSFIIDQYSDAGLSNSPSKEGINASAVVEVSSAPLAITSTSSTMRRQLLNVSRHQQQQQQQQDEDKFDTVVVQTLPSPISQSTQSQYTSPSATTTSIEQQIAKSIIETTAPITSVRDFLRKLDSTSDTGSNTSASISDTASQASSTFSPVSATSKTSPVSLNSAISMDSGSSPSQSLTSPAISTSSATSPHSITSSSSSSSSAPPKPPRSKTISGAKSPMAGFSTSTSELSGSMNALNIGGKSSEEKGSCSSLNQSMGVPPVPPVPVIQQTPSLPNNVSTNLPTSSPATPTASQSTPTKDSPTISPSTSHSASSSFKLRASPGPKKEVSGNAAENSGMSNELSQLLNKRKKAINEASEGGSKMA